MTKRFPIRLLAALAVAWAPLAVPTRADDASSFGSLASAVYDALTGEITVTAENVLSWYIESASGNLAGQTLNLPVVPGSLITNNDRRVGHSSFDAPLTYQSLNLGAIAAPALSQRDLTLYYSPGYGLPEMHVPVLGGLDLAPTPPVQPPVFSPPAFPPPATPPGGAVPTDAFAHATYDAATGALTVTAENVLSWYVESASNSLLAGSFELPATPGALVTNNSARLGHSSFAAPLSYKDLSLAGAAPTGLLEGDLTLHYSPGFGLPEVSLGIPGGLAGVPWQSPSPSDPQPGVTPPIVPDLPGGVIGGPIGNPPPGHDPASAFASASYDAATGALTVTAANVLSWYVESATHSLLASNIELPAAPGALVTNNPTRLGHSSFEAPLSYQDLSLAAVAPAGMPAGDLTLHYSPGYGLPEVTLGIPGGLVGVTWPPQPPEQPGPGPLPPIDAPPDVDPTPPGLVDAPADGGSPPDAGSPLVDIDRNGWELIDWNAIDVQPGRIFIHYGDLQFRLVQLGDVDGVGELVLDDVAADLPVNWREVTIADFTNLSPLTDSQSSDGSFLISTGVYDGTLATYSNSAVATVLAAYGRALAGEADQQIPEPSAFVLAAVGIAAVLTRTRRRWRLTEL